MSLKKNNVNRREFLSRSFTGLASVGALGLTGSAAPTFDQEHIFSHLQSGSRAKKIGIIICARYETCGGGKCLRSMRERVGGFARYPKDMPLEIVGFGQCGGCPGGNVEYVPKEMIKNGAEVIHLATGFVVGYPPCPYTRYFQRFIESYHGLPAVVGTHPIPMKYLEAQKELSSWKEMGELAPYLLEEDPKIMLDYN